MLAGAQQSKQGLEDLRTSLEMHRAEAYYVQEALRTKLDASEELVMRLRAELEVTKATYVTISEGHVLILVIARMPEISTYLFLPGCMMSLSSEL